MSFVKTIKMEQIPPDLVEFESQDRRNVPSLSNNNDFISEDSGNTFSGSSGNNTFNDSSILQSADANSSKLLAASLQALATHCAHLQFRLHQVLAAPSVHRDKLLNELAEFASKPIEMVGEELTSSQAPLIEGLDSPAALSSNNTVPHSVVPTKMLEHLKTQVADLERFVSYLQENESKSPNNSISDNAFQSSRHQLPTSKKLSHDQDHDNVKPLDLRSFKDSPDNSDEDSASMPLHRRLWLSLACGRSRQHHRHHESDESDLSDTEMLGPERIVEKQPGRGRIGSDSCNEDTESVIILLETTVRAFIVASESDVESRIEALAYALAFALTHGIRKDRIAKVVQSKSSSIGSRSTPIPVAACCWNFLKVVYESQGAPPSTEASAARLRASFDVPEPAVGSHHALKTTDMISLLMGAINRVSVEGEDKQSMASPRRKSVPIFSTDANISHGIHAWGRFVRIGLIKPSATESDVSGHCEFPIVLWVRAIASCHRLLRATHFSWAPIRASPERIIAAISLLDEAMGRKHSPNFSQRRHESNRNRRKLSSQNSSYMSYKSSQKVNEDIIIPGV